jgi:hypothetical protein
MIARHVRGPAGWPRAGAWEGRWAGKKQGAHGADRARFTAALGDALAPLYAEGVGVRIRSEFGWITARVPAF